ncbi:MAG: dipicolinate synthase subunit DpsA [Peptococcaceae bacterium]|nr:dipicolinate synthase subunit DpsA [Peptococcaceae bacterium]
MAATLAGLRIGVVGGDLRVLHFIPSLLALGARLYGVGVERLPSILDILHCDLERTVRECHALILPMQGCDETGAVNSNFGHEPTSLLGDYSAPGLLVLSGVAGQKLRELARLYAWTLVEIGDDDELAYLNAVPTAEGAVRLAQELTQKTIHQSKAMVLGLGRCGTILAHLLKNMGAETYVFARQHSDLARAVALGFIKVPEAELSQTFSRMDLVFNTVPALIVGRDLLQAANPKVTIVDIASKPGGIDYVAAAELQRKAVLAPGLPGKCVPESAGQILGAVLPRLIVENIAKER